MLEEGIFDIHCQIVPGVDDGAADIEETRKLLEMEYKQGVRNIILTPHFRFRMFETPLEKVQRQFRLAEEAAADISKDLHLYLGCEFHANMEMLPMLREKKVSTMAGSRYVLVTIQRHPISENACQQCFPAGTDPLLHILNDTKRPAQIWTL